MNFSMLRVPGGLPGSACPLPATMQTEHRICSSLLALLSSDKNMDTLEPVCASLANLSMLPCKDDSPLAPLADGNLLTATAEVLRSDQGHQTLVTRALRRLLVANRPVSIFRQASRALLCAVANDGWLGRRCDPARGEDSNSTWPCVDGKPTGSATGHWRGACYSISGGLRGELALRLRDDSEDEKKPQGHTVGASYLYYAYSWH